MAIDAKPFSMVCVPDSRLSQVSAYVAEVNASIIEKLDRMLASVHQHEGIGLAGVQIGLMERLVVIDIDGAERGKTTVHGGKPLYMVNPEVIESSEEKRGMVEGCLSIPGVHVEVQRPAKVKFKYWDTLGKEQIVATEDPLFAACLQHEIDHTNGILILDYLSPLKRKMSLKKSLKAQKHLNLE